MKRFMLISTAAIALLTMLATDATAQTESLLVEGTGKVNPDFVQVGPYTEAFTVKLKGTLTVGDDVYRFNNAIADVVQIFPPGYTSTFWNDVTLDLGHGNTLSVSVIAHYDAETDCYRGSYRLQGGTGVFAGAQGTGTTLTCPIQGFFVWAGTIR
jgi:hypothetical protein